MPQDQVVARTAPDGGATVERAPGRRGELDLLRALVVVGLVFFHSAVIFGPGEFPVKAETEHPVATVFLAFGATWGMPLLFTISGMGVWYSLRSRGPAGFARERLRRLGSRCWSGCSPWSRCRSGSGCATAGTPPPAPGSTGGSGTCGPR
jgi:Acyltransferase family